MTKRKIIFKNLIIYLAIICTVFSLATIVFFSSDKKTIYAITPIRQVNDGVMLTFNVYSGTNETNQILEILKEYGVTATFFIGGCWANKNSETLLKIKNDGHKIGSHGYYHKDHSQLDLQQNITEIKKSINEIQKITNSEIHLFAPPSGAYNNECLEACKQLNLSVIMWSIDTIDWRDQDVQTIIDRATKKTKNGDIILMHPTAATVVALPNIIETLLCAGYHFATL